MIIDHLKQIMGLKQMKENCIIDVNSINTENKKNNKNDTWSCVISSLFDSSNSKLLNLST